MGLLSRADRVHEVTAPQPAPEPTRPAPDAPVEGQPSSVEPKVAREEAPHVRAPRTQPPRHLAVPAQSSTAPRVPTEPPTVVRKQPAGRFAPVPRSAAPAPESAPEQAPVLAPRTSPEPAGRQRAAPREPARVPVAAARDAPRGPSQQAQVCPVVGRPVCYYGDCHYWSGDRCDHPGAVAETGTRRSRGRRGAAPRAANAAARHAGGVPSNRS